MIITVTLNAAIDKSLSVPNFRLGRRHRTVEQRTMAGGKGVNIARTLKALGQPVIATGFAGGATGHAHRRAAHRGVDPQRLRAHPRGVAHEHLGARPDHRRADRDQRTRPVGLRARGRAVPRQAPLPRARRRDRRVRRVAPARRRARHLRGADPRPGADGGHDRDRHRRRAPAPGGARRARRRLAQRARGRGARRPRVRRRGGALAGGARDRRARPARGDHDAPRRLLRPGARRRPAAPEARAHRPARADRQARLGRRLPGRLPRGALRRVARPTSACASAWPAAPSPRGASAPG